jgi:hypothetical protein
MDGDDDDDDDDDDDGGGGGGDDDDGVSLNKLRTNLSAFTFNDKSHMQPPIRIGISDRNYNHPSTIFSDACETTVQHPSQIGNMGVILREVLTVAAVTAQIREAKPTADATEVTGR